MKKLLKHQEKLHNKIARKMHRFIIEKLVSKIGHAVIKDNYELTFKATFVGTLMAHCQMVGLPPESAIELVDVSKLNDTLDNLMLKMAEELESQKIDK